MIPYLVKALICVTLASIALPANSECFSGDVATSSSYTQPKGAHLSLRTVLKLAQAEASKHEISPTYFEATKFSYNCQSDKGFEWVVLYMGKKFNWQDHPAQSSMVYIVNVNDLTQRASLMPPFADGDRR